MTVAEAHKAHAAARANLELGSDPGRETVKQRQLDRQAPTVEELIAEYLDRWAKPRKRSWKEDERILEKEIVPQWKHLKAVEVMRRDVVILLDRIVDRGAPIQANRTLAVVRRMFNFAISRDIVTANPCAQVRPPGKEVQRDRILSDDELRVFWHGIGKAEMSGGSKLELKLMLVSAQRKSEVVAARWAEIDLQREWWTIPGDRTKNGLPHRVPLGKFAMEILREARKLSKNSSWVFPSPREGHMGPTSADHALRKNLSTLGLVDFTPHDLRRTAASHMTSIGVPRLVISKILNHVEQGVTAVYDRNSYDADKREALIRWDQRLRQILSKGQRRMAQKVVDLAALREAR